MVASRTAVLEDSCPRRRGGRSKTRLLLVLAVAPVFLVVPSAVAVGADVRLPPAQDCRVRTATPAHVGAVTRAVRARRDIWGEQLLAAPGGPTYEAARRFLSPILYAQQSRHRPLTSSGVYYLPLSYPYTAYGSTTFALHVADGSQIVTGRIGGPSLSVYVGARGRERYGACLSRLRAARLAEGYLPILQTSYVDRDGVRYRQESFAGRVSDAPGTISFVRLTIDARKARAGAVVRLVASAGRQTATGDRLTSGKGDRLIVGAGGRFTRGAFQFEVAAGQSTVIFADWLNAPSPAGLLLADEPTYDAARERVVAFWKERLEAGAHFSVPEKRVNDAQKALLIQQMAHTWRYSVGNPYQELSFAEGLDTAEVMSGYGFDDVTRAILRFSLEQLPARFTSWRAGERLVAGALYYQLYRDEAFLDEQERGLERVLRALEARQIKSGPARGRLRPERLSSDLPEPVHGLPGQMVAWQGLLAMGRVWAITGHSQLAAHSWRVALRLEAALRRAVRHSMVRLADRSLFLPAVLSKPIKPYRQITASRAGSYWNLVLPYGLASGFVAPGTHLSDGVIRYLLNHGGRLLGVTRADAHIIYDKPRYPNSGLGQVYGLNVSRFLADNDRADQLVLSLYGMLAIGMTPETYVSGEAVSVTPIGDTYNRKMYLPPNSGANSTFLETLRVMLIHERRGARGAPVGLDLAFSTPRPWLGDGKAIRVDDAPTSFGRVSYSIVRRGRRITVSVTPPASPAPRSLRLRLRLPSGNRLVEVRLGGRRISFDATTGTIDISGRKEQIELGATIARTVGVRRQLVVTRHGHTNATIRSHSVKRP